MFTISIIDKRVEVSKIFSDLGITEVYATKDFQDTDEYCDLIGITRKPVDTYKIWDALVTWFPRGITFKSINDYKDPALRGHKLIWRGGQWYV